MSYNPFFSAAPSQQNNPFIDPLLQDFALPLGKPPKFSGDSLDFEGFVQHCELIFHLRSVLFRSDSHKVAYMFSFMEGDAKLFVAHLIQAKNPILDNYSAFVALLRRVFGNIDIVFNCTQIIMSLKQKRIGEVGQYIKDFEQTSIHLGWNEPALVAKFVDGLHEEVKCELLMRNERIPTLLSAFHKAMTIDTNLQRRYQVYKGYTNASIYNPFVRKMQEEKTDTNPFSNKTLQAKKDSSRRGPLSNEEKQRRRNKGLCMYCGAEGHMVSTCPIVPKN